MPDSLSQLSTQYNVGETSYTYDADGNKVKETTLVSAGRARVSEWTYNHLGRVATSTEYHEKQDIDGQGSSTDLVAATTSYAYDANGNLITLTAESGQVITYTYDNLNRQLRAQRSVLNESNTLTAVYTELTYNTLGNVLTERNEKGQVTTYTYTTLGHVATVKNALGGIEYRDYDRQGRLIKVISPQNYTSPTQASNYTAYSYDDMGRVLATTEVYTTDSGTARSLIVGSNTYNLNGNLLTGTDGAGNVTAYAYDNAGRQLSVTDAEGYMTSYQYDALGRITQMTNARNVNSYYTYDLFGNLLKQQVANTVIMTATYDLTGNTTSTTDGNGNKTEYTYTLGGKIRTVTSPNGYQVRNWYDIMGNAVKTCDSLSKEVITEYDGWGRAMSVTEQHTSGNQAITISTRYDVLGNPTYLVDAKGAVTQYTYDALSRVTAVINPLNQTTTYSYDANGNRLSETDWRGNTTSYAYDRLNRLTAITGADGALVQSLTYYDNHLQHTATDALGNVTTFFYDDNGRLLATQDAEGYTESQSYDGVGNVVSATDGRGMTTIMSYDSLNRLTGVTDPTEAVTEYTYDYAGNMLTQTDGNGNTTRYVYNNLNLPVMRIDPGGYAGGEYLEGYAEHMTYTADGQLATLTDKNGVTTAYTYDIHGRIIGETVGGSTVTNTYDANGNLLTTQDETGTTTRAYDALNRCVSKTVPGFGTTTFAYDLTSGLSAGYIGESTTVDGRTTRRVFDKVKRLYQVIDGIDTSTYSYYANGNLQSLTMPGNIVSSYTYYDNGRLHTLQNKVGNTTVEAYSYAYDGAGNITAKQDGKGTTTYIYNERSQVLTVTEPGGRETCFEYDDAGNRIREEVTQGEETTVTLYAVDERNRLIRTTETTAEATIITTYYYDAAGNVTGRSPEKLVSAGPDDAASLHLEVDGSDDDDLEYAIYSYNQRNQMVLANTNGKVVQNTFNIEGYRVSKTSDGVTTQYLYEYNRVIKEIDSDSKTVYNVYGINLLSRSVNGEKVYYLYNGHGDVTALINAYGGVITTYYYDAFGVLLEESGEYLNPIRYAGYYYDDESKLYDCRARFYDAKLARFMQEDTYRGSPEDPLSLNLYMYCYNNPLVYYDPTGHSPLLAALLGIAATVVVVAKVVSESKKSDKQKDSGDITSGSVWEDVGLSLVGILTGSVWPSVHGGIGSKSDKNSVWVWAAKHGAIAQLEAGSTTNVSVKLNGNETVFYSADGKFLMYESDFLERFAGGKIADTPNNGGGMVLSREGIAFINAYEGHNEPLVDGRYKVVDTNDTKLTTNGGLTVATKVNGKWVPVNGVTQSELDDILANGGIKEAVYTRVFNQQYAERFNAINNLAATHGLSLSQKQFDMLVSISWNSYTTIFTSKEADGSYAYDFIDILIEPGFLTNPTDNQIFLFEAHYGGVIRSVNERLSALWCRRMDELAIFFGGDYEIIYRDKFHGDSQARLSEANLWLDAHGKPRATK